MGEDGAVLQLWKACYAGNVELVGDLIEDDADFCQRDRNGETVLHMAARANNPEVLNLLLDHLSPDVQNHNNQTPLHLAATKGHLDVVQVLLQADCHLEHKTKYSEMTALHLACQHGRTPVVAALLDGGAVCNVADTIGKPPEFYATDSNIHPLFQQHAKHCPHHHTDDHHHHPPSPTTLNPDPPSNPSDDDSETEVETSDAKRRRRRKKSSETDKTVKRHWKKAAARAPKKIKVNHGLGFSQDHKRRMELNVFDRLMGNKKK